MGQRALRWRMRARRLAGFVAIAIAVGVVGACGGSPAPGENVTSTTLPPIVICYEPDGALCPNLDAGEDSGDGDEGGSSGDVFPDH